MRTPDYGEIEAFCLVDGWTALTATTHQPYRKILVCPPDNIVLGTHVSFDRRKTPSPGRWRAMLRHQLQCTENEFWSALRSKKSLDRPCPPLPDVPTGPRVAPNVMRVLAMGLHLSADQIQRLTTDEAVRLAQEYWSRPR